MGLLLHKFAVYFQNIFSWEHLRRAASVNPYHHVKVVFIDEKDFVSRENIEIIIETYSELKKNDRNLLQKFL